MKLTEHLSRLSITAILVVAVLILPILLINCKNTSESKKIDDSDWRLVFEEPFDGFNQYVWEPAAHTFDYNAAYFRPQNIAYHDGKMVFTLKKEEWQGRHYTGAELRTRQYYHYGRYIVRMKAARGSAVVSSFFGFRYNPWQEIDIEFLGKDTRKIHLNIFYNEGPEGAPNNNSDINHQSPVVLDLGFDAAADFHEYAIEWETGELRWYVDGLLIYASSNPDKVPDLSTQIMMNLWYSESVSWAGAPDDASLPTSAEYDYVRFYQKQE